MTERAGPAAVLPSALGGVAAAARRFVIGGAGSVTQGASRFMVNPVTASLVAALLPGEPVGFTLLLGVAAVLAGIWIASTTRRPGS